jgi:hypothetical protein
MHGVESLHTTTRDAADIGVDEGWSAGVLDDAKAWFANVKRTYDEHQSYDREGAGFRRSHDLDGAGRLHHHFDRMATQALDFDAQMRAIVVQRMQNTAETDNMVAKQAMRHSELAIDRIWNVDEVAQLVAKTPVFLDALAAAVAMAVQGTKS